MNLNGVPIGQLGDAIRQGVAQQLLLDAEALRAKVIPEVAHAVLAKALQGTNKAKAVHLGAFKLGWRVEITDDGADVLNDVLYAGVIELGRRPGRPGPPLEPIVEWVRRKLFADQSRPSGVTRSGGKGKTPRKQSLMTKLKKLLRALVKRVKAKLGIKGAKKQQREKKARQTPAERDAEIMRIAIAIRWKIHHKGTKPRFILRDALKVGPKATAAAVKRHLPTRGASGATG